MKKRKIIVFGAGKIGRDFIRMTHYENEVLFIVDNDENKWGKKLEGLEICPADRLKEKEFLEIPIVIAIADYKSVVVQLEQLGAGMYNYNLWKFFYEADIQCLSRDIMDKNMPDSVIGQYPNRDVKNAWMNHLTSNYPVSFDGYISKSGKLLDVGCGCGKTLFNWLCKGYDAYGIDCCEWKMEYCQQKINDFMYPQEWKDRFVFGYGENLPFEDEMFETVSCWYVLEHVKDYRQCIREMIRVTKKGGYILINGPDYRNTYEEHYGIEFRKSLIEHKNEFREYLVDQKRDLSIYEELNFIQMKDIYEELESYVNSGNGTLSINDIAEENPTTRVILRDHKLVYAHRIELVIQKG